MSLSDQSSCPICSFIIKQPGTHNYGEQLVIDCPRCGKFKITKSAAKIVVQKQLNPEISAWLREHKEFNRQPPELDTKNIETIAASLPKYSVLQKHFLLLKAIERRTKFPGDIAKLIQDKDYTLAWANNQAELNYLVESLGERGLIELRGLLSTMRECVITPAGWQYLEEHEGEPAFQKQAFIAMSFDPTMDDAWKSGIKLAVNDAGYDPYRIDEKPHIERIDAKIITEIRNSRFLIADVTEQRPGVYFEAGFALGLNRPVIWSVRKDDLKNVHFDTRQYNHVVWEETSELREKLYYLICAVIGKRN